MNESNSPRAAGEASVQRRSPIERMLVWGAILILLVIVLIEWTSQRNYAATLSAIEKAIQEHHPPKAPQGLKSAQIDPYVHGFAFRGEVQMSKTRQLTFRWPSVFKFYKLGVSVDANDKVLIVENLGPEAVGELPKFDPVVVVKQLPLPKTGLPKGADQVVALKTHDFTKAMGGAGDTSLPREIIRQGFLIAAREELGLSTLDASLGELLNESDDPHSFPFEVHMMLLPSTGNDTTFRIELSRANREGPSFKLELRALSIPSKDWIESLVEKVVELYRNDFVTALREAGFKKADSKPAQAKAKAGFEMATLDFAAQYALLRRLHAQSRTNGESVEALGSLSCAYANLGNLIDFHWSPASKAFKARSMLYAQRLLVKQGKSPLTLAHRAYSRALTGRHLAAFDDLQAARSGEGEAQPHLIGSI